MPRTDLERQARVGRWSFAVAALLCLIALVANGVYGEFRPGNAWGLAYGAAAALWLVIAALYGARRRLPRLFSRRRLGSARAWLCVHLYGGLLFFLLVLMHSRFSWPTGTLSWALWILSAWTVVSGLAGLAAQRWIPRVLTSGLSLEVHYDRIPELVADLRQKAEETAAAGSEPLQRLFRQRMLPHFDRPRRRWIYFIDITGGIRSRLKEFDHLRGFLEGEDERRSQKLERLFRSKLEIDAHFTLQQSLRLWLWLHVPTSMLLVALVALHVFLVSYY